MYIFNFVIYRNEKRYHIKCTFYITKFGNSVTKKNCLQKSLATDGRWKKYHTSSNSKLFQILILISQNNILETDIFYYCTYQLPD